MGRGNGSSRSVLLGGAGKVRGETLGFSLGEAILPKRLTKKLLLPETSSQEIAKEIFFNRDSFVDKTQEDDLPDRWKTDPVISSLIDKKWETAKDSTSKHREIFEEDVRRKFIYSFASADTPWDIERLFKIDPMNEISYSVSVRGEESEELDEALLSIGLNSGNDDIKAAYEYAGIRGNFIDGRTSAGQIIHGWLESKVFDESKEENLEELLVYMGMNKDGYSTEHFIQAVLSPSRVYKWSMGLNKDASDKELESLVDTVRQKIYIDEPLRQISDQILQTAASDVDPEIFCDDVVQDFMKPFKIGDRNRFHQGIRDMNLSHDAERASGDLLEYASQQGYFDRRRVNELVRTSLRQYFKTPREAGRIKFLSPPETRIKNMVNYFFSQINGPGPEDVTPGSSFRDPYVIYNYRIDDITK